MDNSIFQEYQSIDLLAKKNAKKIIPNATSDVWIALEKVIFQLKSTVLRLAKVHGSNFSFICDGKTIVCARRTATLDPSETFYGWQYIRGKSNFVLI